MKTAWVQEIIGLIMQLAPGIVREVLSSDVDSEQFRRINALEHDVDQLRAELAELAGKKRKAKTKTDQAEAAEQPEE